MEDFSPGTEHTLCWGKLIKTRHGDALASWPRMARVACSKAIERGKADVRARYGDFEIVATKSSCTPHPDGKLYQLFYEITVRTP
jgi:hypothetical protein